MVSLLETAPGQGFHVVEPWELERNFAAAQKALTWLCSPPTPSTSEVPWEKIRTLKCSLLIFPSLHRIRQQSPASGNTMGTLCSSCPWRDP